MFPVNTIAQILPAIQIVLSILLIVAILLQRNSGEGGIEGALGGSSMNMSKFSRRGAEKILFISTIVLAILFAVSAVVAILVTYA